MAIEFRVVEYRIRPGVQITEILVDGNIAGVIYPNGEDGIKIISAHIQETETEKGFAAEVIEDDGSRSRPPIPAVNIRFRPSPYVIAGDRVVKLPPQG